MYAWQAECDAFELACRPVFLVCQLGVVADLLWRFEMDQGAKVGPAHLCTRVHFWIVDDAAKAQDLIQGCVSQFQVFAEVADDLLAVFGAGDGVDVSCQRIADLPVGLDFLPLTPACRVCCRDSVSRPSICSRRL